MTDSLKTAFYFRCPNGKVWELISLHDTAEAAWIASIEHKHTGDIWFATFEDDEPVPAKLTNAEFKKFDTHRLGLARTGRGAPVGRSGASAKSVVHGNRGDRCGSRS